MTINLLDGEAIDVSKIEVADKDHIIADNYYYILITDIDTIEA